MTKSEFIDVKISSCVGKSGLADVLVGAHWWDHMEEIEFFLYFLFCLEVLEYCCIIFYLDQVMGECAFNIEFFSHVCQGLCVFRDSEHYARGFHIFYIDWETLFSPSACPQVQYLLRSTCAFNWWSRLRENSFSFLELFPKSSSFFSILKQIDRTNF